MRDRGAVSRDSEDSLSRDKDGILFTGKEEKCHEYCRHYR
jgi:hypothetical protein